MSEDKTIVLAATKDMYAPEVPAVCIDLKENKVIRKVTVKGRRMDLASNSTILSSNGKLVILSSVRSV